MTNNTLSGNSTDGDGGGIWSRGALKVTNTTVTGNRADVDGDGPGSGGGVFHDWSTFYPDLLLDNSIVAGNFFGGVSGTDIPNDIVGPMNTASSHNLIGDAVTSAGHLDDSVDDIKPSNLVLDAEAQLHITDFGLARIEAIGLQSRWTRAASGTHVSETPTGNAVKHFRSVIQARRASECVRRTRFRPTCLRCVLVWSRHFQLAQLQNAQASVFVEHASDPLACAACLYGRGIYS